MFAFCEQEERIFYGAMAVLRNLWRFHLRRKCRSILPEELRIRPFNR